MPQFCNYLFLSSRSKKIQACRSKIEIGHNAVLSLRAEGRLTQYRELQRLRVSDLSAKVLDSLEDELPDMETDQKIKLLGVLTRSKQKKGRAIET